MNPSTPVFLTFVAAIVSAMAISSCNAVFNDPREATAANFKAAIEKYANGKGVGVSFERVDVNGPAPIGTWVGLHLPQSGRAVMEKLNNGTYSVIAYNPNDRSRSGIVDALTDRSFVIARWWNTDDEYFRRIAPAWWAVIDNVQLQKAGAIGSVGARRDYYSDRQASCDWSCSLDNASYGGYSGRDGDGSRYSGRLLC